VVTIALTPQLLRRGVPTVWSHGHDCLGPLDFRCTITAQGELWRVTAPPGASNIATSRADRGLPRICHAAPPPRNPNVENSERLHGKGRWPHPRVHNLYQGGPRGHCRYPEDQIPTRTSSKSRRKTRWAHIPVCPTAPVSWHRAAPEPPRASWLQLPPPGPTAALGPPHAPWPRLLSPGTEQLWDCHMPHGPGSRLLAQDNSRTATCPLGSNSRLLAQDISKAATCPVGRSCGLQAIKVNKYLLAAQPS
jgi:hypothetical protein